MSTKKILSTISLVAGMIFAQSSSALAQWANEPSGSTQYFDCAFSNSICGMANRYNTQAFASPGGSDAVSPSGVLDEYVNGGSSNGNGQWGLDFSPKREIFVSLSWRTTAMGYPNSNNKLIFIKGGNSNSFMVWQGGPGPNGKQLKWYQQDLVDNCHIPGYGPYCFFKDGDGTGWFPANVDGNVAVVAPNAPSFTKIEIYMKSSSTASSKDGIIRIHINGVLSSYYTNVNQAAGGFSNVEVTSAWDGSWTMPETWHHYFDHLHVSFPNGGSVNPVPQPVILAKPANLRFI